MCEAWIDPRFVAFARSIVRSGIVPATAWNPQWTGLAQAAIPAPQSGGVVPNVFYSTSPAEVILFEGQPVVLAWNTFGLEALQS